VGSNLPSVFPLERLVATYRFLWTEHGDQAQGVLDGADKGGAGLGPGGAFGGGYRNHGNHGASAASSSSVAADPYSAATLSQISSLVRMKLLQQVSDPSNLTQMTYRCTSPKTLVVDLALRFNFPLGFYLRAT
jgi:hypothetical protein